MPEDIEKDSLKLKGDFNKQLAKFHKNFKAPAKNGTADAGKFKYNFVQLDDLQNAINKALEDVELTWTQEIKDSENGISVQTLIKGFNGFEEKMGWVSIATSGKAQDRGSAISYARRYSLELAFGVTGENDDDGAQAQQGYTSKPQSHGNSQPNSNMISSKQIGLIKSNALKFSKAAGISYDDVINGYLNDFKANTLENLNKTQASELITSLNKKIEERTPKPATGDLNTDDLPF